MTCGLLGEKLGHSQSPEIHRTLGSYEYKLYEKRPVALAAFPQCAAVVDLIYNPSPTRLLSEATARGIPNAGGWLMLALGGGALLDPESRQIAEATGRVVLMDCPRDELLRRVRLSSARPLLAGDAAARLERLLTARQDHYASFGERVKSGSDSNPFRRCF